MKTVLISFCMLLLVIGLSAIDKLVDFNNPSNLTSQFNDGFPTGAINMANGGLGDTGGVMIPLGMNDVWTLKTGCPVPRIGEAISLSGYFYNDFNNGYGGIGFSASNINNATADCQVVGVPYMGMNFQGGEGSFLNSNESPIVMPWFSDTGDLPLYAWYYVWFYLERQLSGQFSEAFFINSSDINGNIINALHGFSIGGRSNPDFANAGMIYPYFAVGNFRITGFDNFLVSYNEIELPVEMSSFTATVTSQMLVNLQWTTESETNNLGFNVYRSSDSNISNALKLNQAIISGTNTSTTHSYNFTDPEVENSTTYYYWVENVDFNNKSNFSNYITATIDNPTTPTITVATALRNAYPNPFTAASGTKIGFDVKTGETATLTIYNTRGQVVQQYSRSQGSQEVSWNGIDSHGNVCGAGVYFYKLNTTNTSITKKFILLQ